MSACTCGHNKNLKSASLHSYTKVLMLGPILDSDSSSVTNEPVHEISNNVVCATSKASDQPAHTRSLIRAYASRLNNL